MLIMNETQAAENIIANKVVGKKPMQDISLLARYFITYAGDKKLKTKDLVADLREYLKGQYDDYQSVKWQSLIEKAIKKAKTSPIVDLVYIPVTAKELETIKAIGNKKLEKLAFTCLVVAKYYNLRNPSNNGYVNIDYSTLFKLARVTATTYEQPLLLNDLKQRGLVQRCRKVDNPNFRVLFIDNTSEVVLKVEDMRELGYAYLEYIGEPFARCAGCGILMRKKVNNMKYCRDCRGQIMGTKVVVCCDCGKELVINSKNNETCRCDDCYKKYRNNYRKEYMQRARRS